ncbi:dipeptidase [bacterium]|nr:dipeptidase [bacterium]
MSQNLNAALQYARENRDEVLVELRDFLTIPSISDNPEHDGDVRRAAEWLLARLKRLGPDRAQILETNGHPVVFAELLAPNTSAPTVVLYGHYDVQAVEPLDAWDTEPFTPTIHGYNLYARGASDDKGQIMAMIAAVEAVKSIGPLPVSIKFMLEGEEEVGSPSLGECLKAHRGEFACNLVLNTDAGMLGENTPTLVYGLRGMSRFTLRVTGPSNDLHSGGYGGVVHNPIHALCELIAGMHDENACVTLPGFYDSVRELPEEERESFKNLPLNEEAFLKESGAPKLWGEPGFTALERQGARPAFDVIQITAGSPKAAIPVFAEALCTIRLAPHQDPEQVREQVESHLKKVAPPTVNWEIVDYSGFPATFTELDKPGVKELMDAYRAVWGVEPAYYPSGGSIGAVGQIKEILGAYSLLTGFSLPGDHIHGPNEKLHLPTWEKGISALVHFLYHLEG